MSPWTPTVAAAKFPNAAYAIAGLKYTQGAFRTAFRASERAACLFVSGFFATCNNNKRKLERGIVFCVIHWEFY